MGRSGWVRGGVRRHIDTVANKTCAAARGLSVGKRREHAIPGGETHILLWFNFRLSIHLAIGIKIRLRVSKAEGRD